MNVVLFSRSPEILLVIFLRLEFAFVKDDDQIVEEPLWISAVTQ